MIFCRKPLKATQYQTNTLSTNCRKLCLKMQLYEQEKIFYMLSTSKLTIVSTSYEHVVAIETLVVE